ncbi:MAG: glycosyltransferase family 4 protein [Candidatus Roizmanbacteria bacterium]|nr:glycosyltransferase family 4 protein [Candidatus Roizmanbacteria bacterium]
MKTILFLSYDLPYPLDAGGKIRSYHLIRQLSKHYKVRLFYFYRSAKTQSYEDKITPFCDDLIGFKRRPVNSLVTFRYLKKYPFPAALYIDTSVRERIQKEMKRGIDAVHFESFYTSVYLSEDIQAPQLLGTENIEWRVYKDFANVEKNPLMRTFFNFETRRIRTFEKETWRKADRCLAVSPENVREIKEETDAPVSLIKNGVDTDYFAFSHRKITSNTVLFVGNFNYIQNSDAAEYLLTDIAPLMPPEFSLRLVGRNPTPEMKTRLSRAQKSGSCPISVDSDIDDIRDAYTSASVLVAPLRTGSGTKFKILEALASGVPVVATKRAVEGIGVEHEKHVLIADDPQNIVSAVQKISKDKKLHEKLTKNGRKLIESTYSWDAIGNDLRNVYEETFNHHR